ncbi:Vegetative incompatibility protein HET-E-1 [Colletotrichum fructicola]|nr:Vegetative incompatibility protein HET-E-1 [Colletotrichum fructicola]KAF4937035.1 Vegetative incompatibility protein HET-E-1 [Colletotrichum fructicola]
MYLLHIEETEDTGCPFIELRLYVDDIPPYAILSHRWGSPDDEPTFRDLLLQTPSGTLKKGYRKIVSCCVQALEYGLSHAWIDTCCIDKSSSAELSEAINSMYSWYEASRICFAYMEDVPPNDNVFRRNSYFRQSTWFKRGWTLQELIAPDEVIFFDSQWSMRTLGSKSTLSEIISSETGIPQNILNNKNMLHSASVEQKMSWASLRQTTRVEDEAYSLMGLFGVNMPTVYGEGKKAFRRLQEAIMKASPDHTIFAWRAAEDDMYDGMLATSPRPFQQCGQFESLTYIEFIERFNIIGANLKPYYFMTNYGLQIHLPIVALSPHFEGFYFAFLAAHDVHEDTSIIIFLKKRTDGPAEHFTRVRFNGQTLISRPMPDGGYLDFAPATKLLISGNKHSETNFLSAPETKRFPVSFARFSIALTKHTDVIFNVQHSTSSEFAANESSNIHITPLRPAETLELTVLTQGRHVSALLRSSNTRHPLNDVTVSVAFGLHEGEPWAFVDAFREPKKDFRVSVDIETETETLLVTSDLFSGTSD